MYRTSTILPSLTGLRGVAACWVLLFHIGNQTGRAHPDIGRVLDWLSAGGFLGVDLFFVLSGFVIGLNYSGNAAPISMTSYLRFLQKRLARIYPVHFIVLGAMVVGVGLFNLLSIPVARPWTRDAEGLVDSILLLQGWAFPIKATWNIPAWSVSTEWLAYLLFPLISLLATRLPNRLAKLATCAALLWVIPYVVNAFLLRGTMAFGLTRIAVEFTIGVLLYSVWSTTRQERLPANWQWLALFAVLAGGNGLAMTFGEQRTLLVAPLLAAGLIWVLASGKEAGACLSSASAQYLGRISYSLYVVHGVWILFAQSLLRHFELTTSTFHWTAMMTLVLVASLVSARWLYTRIEEPARRRLTDLGMPKQQDAAPAPPDPSGTRTGSSPPPKYEWTP